MDLRLTIVDPRRAGRSVDLAVSAEPGTPLGRARGALLGAAGLEDAASALSCDGVPLTDEAPLGVAPLLQGAILTIGHPGVRPGTAAGTATALLEAHVVAGPDAGGTVPLPPGSWRVGRAAGNAIRLHDPDASRVHAEVVVAATGAIVRDLGSTNGTTVDGRPAGRDGEPTAVADGSRIGIGDSTLVLRAAAGTPAVTLPDGRGHLLVNRAPRLPGPCPPGVVTFPDPPRTRARQRLPWAVVVLPLLLCLPVALIWHQPTLLLLGLSTPALVAVQHATDRLRGRREGGRDRAGYEVALAAAERSLAEAMRAEVERLEHDHPDLAMVAAIASVPTDRLWENAPARGGLVVRVGEGPVQAEVLGLPDPAVHPRAPVTLDLREAGVVGIAGPRPAALGLARAILGQLAVLCSPQDLRIGVRAADNGTDRGADWSWARWLPHYDPFTAVDPLRVRARDREPPESGGEGAARAVVVVLDGGHRLRGEIASWLADGPPRGCYAICLEDEPAALPVECGATVTLDARQTAEPRHARLRRREAAPVDIRADLASARWAHRLARHLAPLREAGPSRCGGIPDSVRLIDLLARDGDPTDAAELARRWAACPAASTTAVLGASGAGPFTVDLCQDGPHALVAGTTGSGKSELLQTLVTSLALANRPDQLSFLLVDYKGGAAFADCSRLPHVTGLVTDLDEHLAGRALASLAAELRRRERLLRQVGASDVAAYATAYAAARTTAHTPADTAARVGARAQGAVGADDATPLSPLPRLVVVVDEFRVLGEELPLFVAGLVRAAVVGRSLGVHLVLATQRPAGAVSADIRANVNLRIALRMTDRADSEDVLDVADAAAIDPSTPGRAVARTGGSAPITFQVARVTCTPAVRGTIEVRVLPAEPPGGGRGPAVAAPGTASRSPAAPGPAGTDLPHGLPETDLQRIVGAARLAAAAIGSPGPPPPWLPPLPDRIRLGDLDVARPHEGIHLVYALADRPARQQQEPLAWRLDGGTHLAAVGGPRSGRTSLLRALAVSASRLGGAVHVHVVDGAGGLAGVDGYPFVGTLVPASDTERCGRLLGRLDGLLREHRAGRSRPSGRAPGDPEMLLLVDGWEAVAEAWAVVEHGRMIDDLVRLMRGGAAAGIHVAVAGGRALLTGPVAELAGERLVLPFPDATDAVLAGVPTARVPRRWPPGRCIRLGGGDPDGVEAQIGVIGPDPDGPVQRRALAGLARPPTGRPAAGTTPPAPWRLQPLPTLVDAADLDAAALGDEPRTPWSVPVGIGGAEIRAVYLPVRPGAGILVAGPPGSGRSTTLARIASSLLRAGHDVLGVSRPLDPPAGEPEEAGFPVEPLTAAALAERPGATVLVDDAAHLAGTSTEALLVDHLRRAGSSGGGVIVACEAGQVVSAYTGLLGQLRGSRLGLLLGGLEPGDGEAFGLRLAPRPAGPPGRGLLVCQGGVTPVQVALPPASGTRPPARKHR